MTFLLLMGLIVVGVGQVINPLLLGYLIAVIGTVLGVLEGEEQGLDTVGEAEEAGPESSPTAEERRQDSGNMND
jgi:hypothetical protein